MKSILKFSIFPKMFEKRACHTQNAPKPTNKNFWNFKNFENFHLWVWVRSGCAKPFFQKISKSWKILKYFSLLWCFHTTHARWVMLVQNYRKMRKIRKFWGIFEKMVEIWIFQAFSLSRKETIGPWNLVIYKGF